MSDPELKSFQQVVEEISLECNELLISKQRDYGPKNILSFGELGVLVRANDKLERLKHNLWKGKVENGEDVSVENESIEDTWKDLRNYAQIALMVRRGQFDLPLEEDIEPEVIKDESQQGLAEGEKPTTVKEAQESGDMAARDNTEDEFDAKVAKRG